MASSLLNRRLCMIIILAASLLFLPLTFSANNNDASAQSYAWPDPPIAHTPEEYEVSWQSYLDSIEEYQRCVRVMEWAGWDPGSCQIANPPPIYRPYSSAQPLDCYELNTCPEPCADVVPTTLNFHDSYDESGILFVDYVYVQDNICLPSGPTKPPEDPRRLECAYEPYNCPPKTWCLSKRCEVIDCGMGTCPICPPGLGNLIIKAWCSYKCYPSGGAIIIIPILGRYLPSLPICIE